MRELGERVRLIHKLGKRAGAEELLDRRSHRADIYKALRSDNVEILKRHALADNALHSGEADSELILKQLADGTHAAVAEVVDIVGLARAVSKVAEVIDRGVNIVGDNELRYEVVDIEADGVLELVARIILKKSLKNDPADSLLDAELGGIEVHEAVKPYHSVSEALGLLAAVALNVDL